MREREAEREELRREREQIRAANKLKRRLLKEEQTERKAEAAREKERKATERESRISEAAIRRAYDRGAKTLGEAMEMARSNPRGTKGRFQRCVDAVSSRGGAVDPRAVCGAQEKKYRKNPLDTNVAHLATESKARAFAAKKLAAGYRWAELHKSRERRHKGKYRVEYGTSRFMPAGLNTRPLEEDVYAEDRVNPADAAMAVSEEFHGRKVKAMIPVQQKRHYHKYLAELGELRKLVVIPRDGKHRVTLSKFDGAMLCTNEDKNQLFIVDGDQSVNLKDFGLKHPHEIETLGEVVTIEYFTDKEHLGDEGGTAVYTHKFRSTNDNGRHKTVRMARNPDLIYYLRDQHLEFSGGSYEIRAEGIDK